jgi:DNA-binding NarL/FixJ family response regulator
MYAMEHDDNRGEEGRCAAEHRGRSSGKPVDLGEPRRPGVLLVDDEPRLRGQLAAVLSDYGIAVVGEAGSGREGVELACQLRPDVVLMDLRMPELDGIEATRLLSELLPSTVVIILPSNDNPALMSEAHQAGLTATS